MINLSKSSRGTFFFRLGFGFGVAWSMIAVSDCLSSASSKRDLTSFPTFGRLIWLLKHLWSFYKTHLNAIQRDHPLLGLSLFLDIPLLDFDVFFDVLKSGLR